jgi:hypothetical protein
MSRRITVENVFGRIQPRQPLSQLCSQGLIGNFNIKPFENNTGKVCLKVCRIDLVNRFGVPFVGERDKGG